jgi:hypothetical protein
LPAGGHCPDNLECFSDARPAERVPCAGPHTWEAFAEGDAPATLDEVDRRTLLADPAVRQVCGPTTFTVATRLMSTQGWTFDILPPDQAALAAGDRTYRCLAGRGKDALTGPTLSG